MMLPAQTRPLNTKPSPRLYEHTPDGRLIPYALPPKTLAPDTRTSETGAKLEEAMAKPSHPPEVPLSKPVAVPSTVEDSWDGWPDGRFELDYDWDAVNRTGSLWVHWACKNTDGDRKGDNFASRWEQGKHSTRQCMGIIKCDNDDCSVLVRPQTTP